MTDTVRRTPQATLPQTKGKRRRMWLMALSMVVLAAGCTRSAAISTTTTSAVAKTTTTNPSTGAIANQQLASVQQICQRWSGNVVPALGNDSASAACATMAEWMSQQLRNRRMTGPMMWGRPTAMRATCRQWMATVFGTASAPWCDELVSWMEQHIGNWDSWMMNGNMMG
jgi:hypothetical protein